jgi:hypothetical protein
MNNLWNSFQTPALSMKSRPFFFIAVNCEDLSAERLTDIMEKSVTNCGYAGFAINAQFMEKGYLSDRYFEVYAAALAKAEELGIKMCLYDENGCPSGSASGQFAERYPEDTVKRLDKLEWQFTGPGTFRMETAAGGKVMGAAAMNSDTKEVLDILEHVSGSDPVCIEVELGEGEWQIMLFVCVKDGSKYVDYLTPASVGKYIEMTHQAYYARFPQYFGSVIDSAFYDEPAMMGEGTWMPGGRLVKEGRMWAPLFNERFKQEYSETPSPHYAALWHDAGTEPHVSRYMMTRLRAELFMEYVRIMAQWCENHGIQLTGHMWDESLINPSSAMGDLMKVFKHQHIPGLDSIRTHGCTSRGVKVVSSAAYNWDKPLVMSESYGDCKYDEQKMKLYFYKEAMDQYAKGVNYMVPHALFYSRWGYFPPELSCYGPYAEELPAYNEYIGRLNTMLQGGRHTADIAVLYPIVDLQSAFSFAVPNDRCYPDYCNYMDIAEALSLKLREDFTFLHPEVWLEKCDIQDKAGTVRLNNEVNFEEFRLLIIPAMEVMDVHSLEKIKEFYLRGGKIIAVGRLPSKASEAGRGQQVRNLVAELFNDAYPYERTNSSGGKSWHIDTLEEKRLHECIREAVGQADIQLGLVPELAGGTLSYIHKIKDGRDIYFIANSSDTAIRTDVIIRNQTHMEIWDPHTGLKSAPEFGPVNEGGMTGIMAKLNIEPVKSLFIVCEK